MYKVSHLDINFSFAIIDVEIHGHTNLSQHLISPFSINHHVTRTRDVKDVLQQDVSIGVGPVGYEQRDSPHADARARLRSGRVCHVVQHREV